MTHEPDHFTPEAVDEQLDLVAQQVRERDPARAESPALQLVADLQHLYDQQARAETESWQRVRQRLLHTDAAARYRRQAQTQPTGGSSVEQPWRTLGQQGGRLGQHSIAPIQRSQRRSGPHIRPGTREARRVRLLHLFRAGQCWSARAITLVAALLLVVLLGGLTLGLILVHRSYSGAPAVTIEEFALPAACGADGCVPVEITSGPDGNLWFTEANANASGRITPTGQITEFPIPMANNSPSGIANSGPSEITRGPDGNLWFTEQYRNSIGRITPMGTIQAFSLPTACSNSRGCGPTGITTGPDGNLWFTEQYRNSIGRITPTGTIQEFSTACSGIATGCNPSGITSGPDGNLWFTEYGWNSIGRITPAGRIQEFPLPTTCTDGCLPHAITSGPDGNLWFTEAGGNTIGRITPTGHIQEFALPAPCNNQHPCGPVGITSGPDGNLWFTEQNVSKIGRISP